MVDISIFGKRVKEERLRLKLTQEELSEKLGGGNRSRIAAWENGKLKEFPSLEVVDALAAVFSCDIEYLVGKQDLPRKAETDINTVTGLSEKAIENLRQLQAQIIEKGKHADGRLDTQDVVNMLLSYDGFFVISAITDLFNTPKGITTLLNIEGKGSKKTVCPINAWSAVMTWVQETLSQAYDRIKERGQNGNEK